MDGLANILEHDLRCDCLRRSQYGLCDFLGMIVHRLAGVMEIHIEKFT